MLVILTGAIKNVGDYLIGERAKGLLHHFTDEEIIELSRFEPIDDAKLKTINRSKALILCGGPAYVADIYPRIYPLEPVLDQIKVPIIPFGLGWTGKPFPHPDKFEFTPKASAFLDKVHQSIPFSSCRDVLTESILNRYGWKNVIMTGCPAWYDLAHLKQDFRIPKTIRKIVLTTPANQKLGGQFVKVLKLVKKHFPEAELHSSFHKGILPNRSMPFQKPISYMTTAARSWMMGAKVIDVASDLKKIDFYASCDLHIGYRVHGHLYFLAKRLPSMLINEDGRGLGMIKSMNLPVLNHDDAKLLTKLEEQIIHYKNTQFADFQKVATFIDGHIGEMKRFFKSLPTKNQYRR